MKRILPDVSELSGVKGIFRFKTDSLVLFWLIGSFQSFIKPKNRCLGLNWVSKSMSQYGEYFCVDIWAISLVIRSSLCIKYSSFVCFLGNEMTTTVVYGRAQSRNLFIKSRLPSKVVFHQRVSSIKGHLPSKVVFHRRSSYIEGILP